MKMRNSDLYNDRLDKAIYTPSNCDTEIHANYLEAGIPELIRCLAFSSKIPNSNATRTTGPTYTLIYKSGNSPSTNEHGIIDELNVPLTNGARLNIISRCQNKMNSIPNVACLLDDTSDPIKARSAISKKGAIVILSHDITKDVLQEVVKKGSIDYMILDTKLAGKRHYVYDLSINPTHSSTTIDVKKMLVLSDCDYYNGRKIGNVCPFNITADIIGLQWSHREDVDFDRILSFLANHNIKLNMSGKFFIMLNPEMRIKLSDPAHRNHFTMYKRKKVNWSCLTGTITYMNGKKMIEERLDDDENQLKELLSESKSTSSSAQHNARMFMFQEENVVDFENDRPRNERDFGLPDNANQTTWNEHDMFFYPNDYQKHISTMCVAIASLCRRTGILPMYASISESKTLRTDFKNLTDRVKDALVNMLLTRTQLVALLNIAALVTMAAFVVGNRDNIKNILSTIAQNVQKLRLPMVKDTSTFQQSSS